ncbi:hypothetical protein MGO_03549 [Candida albicans P76055]|nr:hypothetical protein MGO_03549 [Candida albicans P76055]
MGLKCTNYFENSKYESPNIQIITCKGCSSHLCLSDLILSDNFNGASGPAYLVEDLINIEFNLQSEETPMKTGVYKINKVKCHQCKNQLGWYYKKSYSFAETYKEGKFVIERKFINFTDNLTTTQLLTERALQNKFKRRYSNNSTNSSTSNTSNSSTISNNSISDLEIDESGSSQHESFLTKEKFKLLNRRRSSGTNGNINATLLNHLRIPYHSIRNEGRNGAEEEEDDDDDDEDHHEHVNIVSGTTTTSRPSNIDDDDIFVDA